MPNRSCQATRERPGADSAADGVLTRQTAVMERDYAIGIVQREAGRVLQLAQGKGEGGGGKDQSAVGDAQLGLHVPSCPEWDFADLVKHLGNVYNWAGTIVEGRLPAPPGPEIPRRPDGMALSDWLEDRLDRLVTILREVPDDATMWNFSAASPGPPAFWWRRQLHETAIHRVDAELACSVPVEALEPELAADNVSELFEILSFSEPADELADAGATGATSLQPGAAADTQPALIVHLHATDLDGAEWTIDTVARTIRRAHAKGDVAVQGTAWALARWSWGRPVAGEIEVFGDFGAAEAWRRSIAP
jgi:uncharacterized protein (TIGR03083 family)